MNRVNFSKQLSIACIGISLATDASAADVRVIESKDNRAPYVLISGDIVMADVDKLRRAIIASKPDFVFLNSRGGSTMAAIEMGKLIRLSGMNTGVVPSDVCASACGLVWLAGTQRVLSEGARVGFHATYIDNNGQRMESGVGNALVGHYLGQLSLSEKAIAFTSSAPPNGMNWLNSANWRNTGIEVSVFSAGNDSSGASTAKAKSNSAENVYSSIDVKISTAGAWEIGYDRNNDNTCYMKGGYDGGTNMRVGFATTDSNTYFISLGNPAWSSIVVGKKYPLSIEFDGMGAWDLPTTGALLNGKKILVGYSRESDFLVEMAKATGMRIKFESRLVDGLKMTDTRNAITTMIDCAKKYTFGNKINSNPPLAADPFKPR